ncbi:MAG TPA: hypothetical protein VGQ93_14895 [Lysobacter sp.]|nr:hypothetical protein [Lysobacter sp.]
MAQSQEYLSDSIPTPMVVVIVVGYLEDGTPRVYPSPAEVRVSGTIIWRTFEGEPRPFTIAQKQGPRGWEGEMQLPSHTSEGHQVVTVPAQSKEGEYHYSVTANGYVLDPDIYIKPH